VYGTVDFDDVSGTASVVLPGKNNQTGVALGLRTIFQVPHGTARHVTPGIHAGRRPRKWRAHKKRCRERHLFYNNYNQLLLKLRSGDADRP
jgi:hypothetical protein